MLYGIFNRGGYGDGYETGFGFKPTPEAALEWVNSPASLSLFNPETDFFLGEVTPAPLLPQDDDSSITERLTVHRWWKLVLSNGLWTIGDELANHPESLGLSPLE